jgi:hypothetical protein
VAGDLAHDLQDAGVLDVAGAELDVDHGPPLFSEKSPFLLTAGGTRPSQEKHRAGQKEKSPFHRSIFLETAAQINFFLALSPEPP